MKKDALMIKFKYPAACMQNFYRMRLAAPSQDYFNQKTNGPVNAHLISWPSKAQNIQNLENI